MTISKDKEGYIVIEFEPGVTTLKEPITIKTDKIKIIGSTIDLTKKAP